MAEIEPEGERYTNNLLPGELRVVCAILAGHTTRNRLAAHLIISKKTVQGHLYRIYSKTGAVNMTELVLMAVGHLPCMIDLVGQVKKAGR
jgi:DNA-binding CsgD family transcriptional regulator